MERNLPPEIKKQLFLRYAASPGVYKGYLVDDYSVDRFGYAPKTYFRSLSAAGLSSADTGDVLIEAFKNLEAEQTCALTENPWGNRPYVLEQMNLDDDDILRLIAFLETLPNTAHTMNVLIGMIRDKSKAPGLSAGNDEESFAGRPWASSSDQPGFEARIHGDATAADRRRMIDEWVNDYPERHQRLPEGRYDRNRLALWGELRDILGGLARWDLGVDYNASLLARLIGPDQTAMVSEHSTDLGFYLSTIPLPGERAMEFYRVLHAAGMDPFRTQFDMRIGDALFVRIMSQQGIGATQQREVLELVLNDPRLQDDLYGANFWAVWTGEEANFLALTKALGRTYFSVAEDLRYMSRFPFFSGKEQLRALAFQKALNPGQELPTPDELFISQAIRSKFPRAVDVLNEYIKMKRDQILAGKIPSGAPQTGALPAQTGRSGLPAPSGRSELRLAALIIVENLLNRSEYGTAGAVLINGGLAIIPEIQAAGEAALAKLSAESAISQANFENRIRGLLSQFNEKSVYVRQTVTREELDLMGNQIEELRSLIDTVRNTVSQYGKVVTELRFPDNRFLEALKRVKRTNSDNVQLLVNETENKIIFHNKAFKGYGLAMRTPFEVGLNGELLTNEYADDRSRVIYPERAGIAAGFFLAALTINAARLANQPSDDIVALLVNGRYKARSQEALQGFAGLAANFAQDYRERMLVERSA